MLRVWNPNTGGNLITFWSAPERNNAWLALSPDGHYAGSEDVENEIVYVAETDAGQETLAPAQFATRFHWKNDPTRVHLLSP